jgi:6-phosphofructokinase
MTTPKRIGILTSGGDCPGLNAVIRAVVKCANRRGWDVIGIPYSTDGLVQIAEGKV